MRSAFAILALAISLVGCEATDITTTPDSPNQAYRPVDGRDIDFDTHRTNPGGPMWPADTDTGASSGMR